MEQFSLMPSNSDVLTRGRACPGGIVTFTCTASELDTNDSIYWYLNQDQVSTVHLSSSASYPKSVNTSRVGVNVTVDSEQEDMAITNLTLVLSQQRPRSVGCGTRSNKTSANIACNLHPQGMGYG